MKTSKPISTISYNSEEFLKAIDHTYYNAIGKAVDENEFFDF